MNQDIRVSLDFWDHHKTIHLKRALGYEGIEAITRIWFYAAKYRPDGHLTKMSNEDIAIVAHWSGDPDHLIEILSDKNYPWLDKLDAFFSIHNWKKRNPYAIFSEKRSRQARKAAEARYKKGFNNHDVNAERMLTDNADSMLTDNAPYPYPYPEPNPKPDIKKNIYSEVEKNDKKKNSEDAQKVLDYFNQKTGRKFRNPCDLEKRFKEGYTVEDAIKVIDNKLADQEFLEYKGGKYMRPETLFSKGHFDSYLNQGKSNIPILQEEIFHAPDEEETAPVELPSFLDEIKEARNGKKKT